MFPDDPDDPDGRAAADITRMLDEVMPRSRPAEPVVTGSDSAKLARAAELGAEHGRERRWIPPDHIPGAFGVGEGSELMYMVMAAYQDSRAVARAEADPRNDQWPQPISPAHKTWLKSNLVNQAALASMLKVPIPRVTREARSPGWPEPVINVPRKHWYWWPHLQPALASRGLVLAPCVTPPAGGPAPTWWEDLPASPDFGDFLRENLVDLAMFSKLYNLDRQAILKAARWPDYPEPVIGRRGNYWYWLPDLDRFLVRHPDTVDPGRDARDPSWPSTVHAGIKAGPSPAAAVRRTRPPRNPVRPRPPRAQ